MINNVITMKKIIFLIVAITAIVFTGCDTNGGENGNGSGNLIGKWESIAGYDFVNGEWVDDGFDYIPNEFVREFTKEHMITYIEGRETGRVTYSFDKSKMTLTYMGIVVKIYKLTATEFEVQDGGVDNKTLYKRIEFISYTKIS